MPENDCPTCNNQSPHGEPVRGQEDVFAYTPATPPDSALTAWPEAMVATSQAGMNPRTALLEGIPPPPSEIGAFPGNGIPVRQISGPAAKMPLPPESVIVGQAREGLTDGVIFDQILDATPSAQVEYLPRMGAPWFAPGSLRHEPSRAPGELGSELMSVAPPPPPPRVPKVSGGRIASDWPEPFGKDLGNCKKRWLYEVRVKHEVGLGEHVHRTLSTGFERQATAESLARSVPVREAEEMLAQVKADWAADRASRELETSSIIEGADTRNWQETLEGLVSIEVGKLKDPCPRDCPMTHYVFGWHAEIESVTATHFSTDVKVETIFVGGIDVFYHVVWTIKHRLKATYLVHALCEFYCFGVDEF